MGCAAANQAVAGRFEKLNCRVIGRMEAHQTITLQETLDDLFGLVAFFTRENVNRNKTSSTKLL
jgi:hypothetical protein